MSSVAVSLQMIFIIQVVYHFVQEDIVFYHVKYTVIEPLHCVSCTYPHFTEHASHVRERNNTYEASTTVDSVIHL